MNTLREHRDHLVTLLAGAGINAAAGITRGAAVAGSVPTYWVTSSTASSQHVATKASPGVAPT